MRWSQHGDDWQATARLTALDEGRLLTAVLRWKDATYCEVVRGLRWRASDPGRSPLGTRRKGRPLTRWEDPIQSMCSAQNDAFIAWQSVAQDKATWDA